MYRSFLINPILTSFVTPFRTFSFLVRHTDCMGHICRTFGLVVFNCIKHAFYRFKPGALLEDESESEDEDSKDPSNEKFKVIDFCGLTTLILFLTSSP